MHGSPRTLRGEWKSDQPIIQTLSSKSTLSTMPQGQNNFAAVLESPHRVFSLLRLLAKALCLSKFCFLGIISKCSCSVCRLINAHNLDLNDVIRSTKSRRWWADCADKRSAKIANWSGWLAFTNLVGFARAFGCVTHVEIWTAMKSFDWGNCAVQTADRQAGIEPASQQPRDWLTNFCFTNCWNYLYTFCFFVFEDTY